MHNVVHANDMHANDVNCPCLRAIRELEFVIENVNMLLCLVE